MELKQCTSINQNIKDIYGRGRSKLTAQTVNILEAEGGVEICIYMNCKYVNTLTKITQWKGVVFILLLFEHAV